MPRTAALRIASSQLPLRTIQDEWNAMMQRIKEVAHVLDHAEEVDMEKLAHIILEPVGTDLEKVEEILFSNLLFAPHGRIEDGNTIEISGEWRCNWRRYADWTIQPARIPPWVKEKYTDVRMFDYHFATVEVLLA